MVETGQYQRATGRLPQWYTDAPDVREENQFYLRAFWELNTERYFRRGPIPANCTHAMAERLGLLPDVAGLFFLVVRALDEEFLTYTASEN